ncbi:MAG: PAS domain S-box protein [Dehalococcoidia bacterium]|nr:PAS domain S-box protein [Dehalococcoidia bacterium]
MLLLISALPVSVVTLLNTQELRRQTADDSRAELGNLAKSVAEHQERIIEGTGILLLAEADALKTSDPVLCGSRVTRVLSDTSLYANIGAANTRGEIFCSALQREPRPKVADRSWFSRSLKAKGVGVGEYQIEPASGKPSIIVGYPFRNYDGEVQGVVFAAIDLTWLSNVTGEINPPTGSVLTLTDREVTILVRYPESSDLVGQKLPEVELPADLVGDGTTSVAGPDGSLRWVGFARTSFISDGAMTASISLSEENVFADVDSLQQKNLATQVLRGVLIIVLTWVFSERLIISPVGALASAARRLAAGDLTARTGLTHGSDELGELARAFDEMADARQQVEAARSRLVAVVESSNDAVISTSTEGVITSWNAAAERLYGYSAAEALGQPGDFLIAPDRIFEIAHLPIAVGVRQVFSNFETVRVTKGGRHIPVSVKIFPLLDPAGQILGQADITTDISARLKAEATETRLAALVESSADAIIGYTLEGVVTDWNRAAERLYGYSANEAMGKSLHLVTPPDRRDELHRILGQIAAGESAHFETVRMTKEGRMVDVSIVTSPVRDTAGNVVGGSSIIRDVTEQKRLMEALRQSESQLSLVYTQMNDAVFYLGVEHGDQFRFISVNPAFTKATGLTAIAVVGKLIQEVVPEPSLQWVLDRYKEAIREKKIIQWNDHSNYLGGAKHGEVSIAPVFDAEGRCTNLVGTRHDVTEQQQAADALAQRARDLQRSNEQLEQFAYVASHDLQEPLRMVASYTQLLRRRYGEQLDAAANEYIDFAVDGANRMQSLIKDLLEFSRVDRRGAPLKPVSLDEVVKMAVDSCQLLIQDSGAEVIYAELPVVLGDQVQLMQVFQNLLANAIKFRRDVAPRIVIEATREGGMWSIRVVDNGIGFNERFNERIFEMFERLHTRKDYPGTGIGLAIVRRIVERHGGAISARSQPGVGSVFTITLKATSEREAPL